MVSGKYSLMGEGSEVEWRVGEERGEREKKKKTSRAKKKDVGAREIVWR